jgi:putative peptidoglycan lipid II flippase
VLGFAVRKGFLQLDREWLKSLVKFAVSGIVLAVALWLTAQFASVYFAQMSAFRDELALLLLLVSGMFVYGFSILVLFGRGWIFSLIRG